MAAKSDSSRGKTRRSSRRQKTSFSDRELAAAYRQALVRFAHRSYVTGVTIGEKIKEGRYRKETVIRVHVREKIPKSFLRKAEVFPVEVEGVPVDVVERSYGIHASLTEKLFRKNEVLDPVQPGIGISRADVSVGSLGPGTLGLVAFDRRDGAPCLLSAAHVLAGGSTAKPGDPILQPSPQNGGRVERHTIAELRGFMLGPKGDAAFARLVGLRRVNPTPLGISTRIVEARMPQVGDVLVKSGRTTAVTRGRVESIGMIEVPYPDRPQPIRMCGFELRPVEPGNPAGEEITEAGDSGAVWFDPENGAGVGLHVAGVDHLPQSEHSLACFLPSVLDELGLSLTPTDLTGDLPFTDETATVLTEMG